MKRKCEPIAGCWWTPPKHKYICPDRPIFTTFCDAVMWISVQSGLKCIGIIPILPIYSILNVSWWQFCFPIMFSNKVINKHRHKWLQTVLRRLLPAWPRQLTESINCLLSLNDDAKLRTDLSEFKSSCNMGSWLLATPVWWTISSTACWARSNDRQAKYTLAPDDTTENVSVCYISFSGKSAETTTL